MPVIILLFSLMFPSFIQATFVVTGNVRNQSGQFIAGVRLSVTDENFQPVYTGFIDSSGRFTVRGLRQGKFTFRIETTGTPYEEQVQMLELQGGRLRGTGSETFLLDFILRLKRSREGETRKGTIFAQDVPQAARKELERGVKYLKSGKTDQGIAALKKAIEVFPDYFEALELLGTEYVKGGQSELAIPILVNALGVNKSSPRGLYALGVAHLKLNHLTEAIVSLEKAAQLDSNNANTQMMLGLAYGNSRAFDKSEAVFRKALQLGGEAAAEAHFYLAGLYNKQEKYRKAWQELELYLKEAKDIKDPAQVKAMIVKLKEKETTKPAQSRTITEQPALSVSLPQPAAPGAGAAENSESTASSFPSESVSPPPGSKNKAPEPVPALSSEMVALLGQCEKNGGVMHRHLLDYTYQLKKTRSVLNGHGKAIQALEQVFEAYPVQGEHVLILLTQNGIPSRSVSDDRKRAVKQLEDAEREHQARQQSGNSTKPEINGYVSAGVSGVYGGRYSYVSINVSEFIRSCEFFSPGEETIAGRPTVVLNFRPRAGASLAPNYSYIRQLIGRIWIDQADRIVTRLEGWPASEAAFDLVQATAPRDEAALIYQQERRADGLWFPGLIRMNAGGRPELFDGLNWDVVFEFRDYQRFNTSASEKVPPPQTPQTRNH